MLSWLHTVPDRMQIPELSSSSAPQHTPGTEAPALSTLWLVSKRTRLTVPLNFALVPGSA